MAGISIALLTYNGDKYLRQVLQMIQRQKKQPDEILALDSESDDSTLQILREYGIPITHIKHNEFSHPGTRNLAARLCSGAYVAFLTQDAIPADSCWLENLLQPFEEFPNVAGAYSRQIPHQACNPLEASDLKREFPPDRKVKSLQQQELLRGKQIWNMIQFSNCSSVYDRQLLLKYPFNEQLEMGEDQEWSKRMLEQGFSVVYEPSSIVVHSHEHTLRERYMRSLKMGRSFSTFLKPVFGRRSAIREFAAFLLHVLLDFRYTISTNASIREKTKWLFRSPGYRATAHYAFRKGWNSVKKFPVHVVSIPGRELA